jgi:hypothetical protein
MAEDRPLNPGPWDDWENFPKGPIKKAIEELWADDLASVEKVGAHFALQVTGTNPISGYRVYLV